MATRKKNIDTSVQLEKILSSGSEGDEVLSIIKEELKIRDPEGKYYDLKPIREGECGRVFSVRFGPKGERRVIKVDKIPQNPQARVHFYNGCNTAREVNYALGIDDPEKHHLIRIHDYMISGRLKDKGLSGAIVIEEFFQGKEVEEGKEPIPAKTLYEFMEERRSKGVELQEFKQIGKGLVKAIEHLIKNGEVYHRDPHPGNILIKENGGLEIKLADFGNVCPLDEISPKPRPTAGSRYILDPSIMEVFTGKIGSYDFGAEAYAIGKDFLVAATGTPAVICDPNTGEAINLITKEKISDEDGRIDVKKHDAAIEMALKLANKDVRNRYGSIIKRTLTLDKIKRYHNIDELAADWENASKPSFMEKLRSRTGLLAAGLGILTMSATPLAILNYFSNRENKDLTAEVLKRERVPVAAKWSGKPLEIGGNGMVKLKANVYKYGDYDNRLEIIGGENTDKYLQVNPGDEVWLTISAKQEPTESWGERNPYPPTLEGKAYIEGWEGKDFEIWPDPFDETVLYGDMHGYGGAYKTIKVPKDIAPGNYNLTIEFYAPENLPEDANISNGKAWWFKQPPGEAINRKGISLVVGDPKKKVDLDYIVLGWYKTETINLKKLNKEKTWYTTNPNGVYYELSIPEYDTTWSENSYYPRLPKPRMDRFEGEGDVKTLQVVYRDENGEYLGYRFIPIVEDKRICDTCPDDWKLGMPNKDWSNRLVGYRENIYTRYEADKKHEKGAQYMKKQTSKK